LTHQERLEHCANGCCQIVDGKIVTSTEYEQAKARHPGNYPGIGPGQRNAIVEHKIACRGIKWVIRKVVNNQTEPLSSPGGRMGTTEIITLETEGPFMSDAEAQKRADELGKEYCIAPLIGER
jgi:hypothetical protein